MDHKSDRPERDDAEADHKEPVDPGDSRRQSTKDMEDLRKRVADEYKMLQDKIDKIGAFRFTIKGWAVAIVGAVSAASSVTGAWTALFITICLACLVVFFFHLEVEQVHLSHLFGARA